FFRFRLGPEIALSLSVRVKKPGAELVSTPTELAAVRNTAGDEVDAYERLLTDAMRGDATLFVREDAVEAARAIVDPILNNVVPVHPYQPGTWGPPEAAALTSDVEGWRDPDQSPKVYAPTDAPDPATHQIPAPS